MMRPAMMAVALLVMLLHGAAVRADDSTVAKIRSLTGKAWIVAASGDTPRAATKGSSLAIGQMLRTDEGTMLVLDVPGEHVVTLGPAATAIRWTGGRLSTTTITVFRGQTSHRVHHLEPNGSYRVTTPVAVSGVRGTEFTVESADDGSSRTHVATGTVELGEDEAEQTLEAGEEQTTGLVERTIAESGDRWFAAACAVSDPLAQECADALAERMRATREATENDLDELASLSTEVAGVVAHPPRSVDDAAGAIDLLTRGLRLYRRMESRRESMACRHALAQSLARAHACGIARADTEMAAFEGRLAGKTRALDSFIGGLERLSTLIKAAQAVERGSGILRRLPFPF